MEEPEEEEEVVEAEEENWARGRSLGPLASLHPRPGEGPGHSAPSMGAQARSTATQGMWGLLSAFSASLFLSNSAVTTLVAAF